jgi:cytochrome c-type biogenesis protein CcmH
MTFGGRIAGALLAVAAVLPAQAAQAAQVAQVAQAAQVLQAAQMLQVAQVAQPPSPAASTPASPPMPTPEQAEALMRTDRFRELAAELRCLVCQNQTLADSGAELAIDLRNEVLRQMAAGRDNTQIKERLVERYGEFVLYRPAFSARNLALWGGPALLMAIGMLTIWRLSRRRLPAATPTTAADDATLRRVERLLADDPPATDRPPRA